MGIIDPLLQLEDSSQSGLMHEQQHMDGSVPLVPLNALPDLGTFMGGDMMGGFVTMESPQTQIDRLSESLALIQNEQTQLEQMLTEAAPGTSEYAQILHSLAEVASRRALYAGALSHSTAGM